MPSEVNFLPEELKPKGYAVKLSKKLRKIAIICLSVFFITTVLYIGSNVLFSFEQKKLDTSEEELKGKIEALEETEQKLVLAQDRLQKIAAVHAAAHSQDKVDIASKILGKDLEGITIENFTLDNRATVVTFSTGNSQSITKFFTQLLNSDFKDIKVTSFNFDVNKGYEVEVTISS